MRFLLPSLFVLGICVGAYAANDGLALSQEARLAEEARTLITAYSQELKQTVNQTASDSGYPNAVLACQTLAPVITAKHTSPDWSVGRTSLKVRNTANQPDVWEHAVLERFAEAAASGTPLQSLRHAEIVGNEFRYMQAIPAEQGCLNCHGSTIDPQVQATILQHYPEDRATGFSAGDLRGAFTLRHPLTEE